VGEGDDPQERRLGILEVRILILSVIEKKRRRRRVGLGKYNLTIR